MERLPKAQIGDVASQTSSQRARYKKFFLITENGPESPALCKAGMNGRSFFGERRGGKHLTQVVSFGRYVLERGQGEHVDGEEEQDNDLPVGIAPGGRARASQTDSCASGSCASVL